jgi:hypothetical protein
MAELRRVEDDLPADFPFYRFAGFFLLSGRASRLMRI